jgi:hypothetical protein
VVKLTVNNATAVAGNNYTVFGATNATGFTYRFV